MSFPSRFFVSLRGQVITRIDLVMQQALAMIPRSFAEVIGMCLFRFVALAALFGTLVLPSSAEPLAAPNATPLGDAAATAAFTSAIRSVLRSALPDPLYEKSKNWGKTTRVFVGFKWTGKGIHGHVETRYADRNHGTWSKVRLTSRNGSDSLVVNLRDLRDAGPGRATFTLLLALDAQVYYERQHWTRGVRVYDDSVRARLRITLALQCECVFRIESTGGLLPDAVFRLRALKADLGYDNLVVEHFAGFGGTTAKLIGEMIQRRLQKWHPALQRRLLQKADAAIIKAGDTREIHIGLGKLLHLTK